MQISSLCKKPKFPSPSWKGILLSPMAGMQRKLPPLPSLILRFTRDSYFACCPTRQYSGVATFVRSVRSTPVWAEEGCTGILCKPNSFTPPPGWQQGIDAVQERYTPAELQVCCMLLSTHCMACAVPSCVKLTTLSQELDSEGRVVMTDHGAFVLINVYGPAISSEERLEDRFAFKLQLYEVRLATMVLMSCVLTAIMHYVPYHKNSIKIHKKITKNTTLVPPTIQSHPQALSLRLNAFLDSGRRVMVVGDLNIAPFAADRAEGDVLGLLRRDRAWLHSLLRVRGGPFVDAYRELHPHRYV